MDYSLGKTWARYVVKQVRSRLLNNASDSLRRQPEQLLKLEALRRDIAQGMASVKAGYTSRTGPDGIVLRAKARKQSR